MKRIYLGIGLVVILAGYLFLAKSSYSIDIRGGASAAGSGDVATDILWDAAGDLAVGTGANTAAKLSKGAANTILHMKSDASTVEWTTWTVIAPTTGGILYGTGTGVYTPLAKGTAAQLLQMNAGATAPEWTSSISSVSIDLGTPAAANYPVTMDAAGVAQIGSNVVVPGTLSVTGHPTFEGVTATGATGTGLLVFGSTPTLTTPVLGAATGTSLIATGIIDGTAPITITATSAGYTIPTPNGVVPNYSTGYIFTNPITAGATFYVTLPPAAAGLQYCVGNGAAKTGILRVTAVGDDQIDLDGTLGTAAGWATATAVAGNFGCFIGVSSTQWKVIPTKGTWTIAGP